jgi:type III secretory pathway component EscR
MNVDKIKKIVERQEVINFVPKSLKWMTKIDHIDFKASNEKTYELKTAFLLDIIHTLRAKGLKVKDNMKTIQEGFPLSSKVMMSNYHNDYKYYKEYLLENDLIVQTKNHQQNVNSACYRLRRNLYEENYEFFKNDHKKIVKKEKRKRFTIFN